MKDEITVGGVGWLLHRRGFEVDVVRGGTTPSLTSGDFLFPLRFLYPLTSTITLNLRCKRCLPTSSREKIRDVWVNTVGLQKNA